MEISKLGRGGLRKQRYEFREVELMLGFESNPSRGVFIGELFVHVDC